MPSQNCQLPFAATLQLPEQSSLASIPRHKAACRIRSSCRRPIQVAESNTPTQHEQIPRRFQHSILEPSRIRPHEHKRQPWAIMLRHALHERSSLPPVRWIAPYPVAPRKLQPIILHRVIQRCTVPRSANRSARIQIKRPQHLQHPRRSQPRCRGPLRFSRIKITHH